METEKKMRIPDIFECIFDISYLQFALLSGIFFLVFSEGSSLALFYGILALTLMFGDAFHLIPRVIRAIKGDSERINRALGRGLQVSSVTMTAFYVVLVYVWKNTFPELKCPLVLEIIIWVSALVRIVICLLPQNNWLGDGNKKLSVIRNTIFLITGIGVIVLYAISGNAYGRGMYRMIIAITLSFGFYFPVIIWAKKYPKIGMLMIPKTLMYIWMILMGLRLMFTV